MEVLSHSVVSDSLWPHGLCSPPGSSVHGILQAWTLEWVAMSSSRGGLPEPGIALLPLKFPTLAGGFFITSIHPVVYGAQRYSPEELCPAEGLCHMMTELPRGRGSKRAGLESTNWIFSGQACVPQVENSVARASFLRHTEAAPWPRNCGHQGLKAHPGRLWLLRIPSQCMFWCAAQPHFQAFCFTVVQGL